MTGGVLLNASRQVATGAAAAGTMIVVARVLGPSGAGAYAVAQAAIAILTVATTLGIENGVIFRVASGVWDAGGAFRAALKAGVVAGSIGVVAGLAVRVVIPSAFAGLSLGQTAVALAAVPFALATILATSCAVAIDRYEAYTFLPTLQAGLALLGTAAGAWAVGLSGAIVGLATAIAIVGSVSTVWGLRLPVRRHQPALRQLRSALRFGIASYGSNALQLINYRLDLFILSIVTTSAAVGQYSVAVAVSSVLWLLPGGLSDLLFPRVAQLGGPGGETQRDMVEAKALRHATLVVGTTSVLLAAVVDVVIVPVFGEGFEPAIALTLILIPGAALAALARVLAASVVGRGRPTLALRVALITTPLTVILYVVLIPWLHASGAALASTLSYSTSFLLFAWYFQQTSGKRVLPLLVPTRSEIDDLRALPRALATRVARG
jgi:O-antigen/teichoic acid export membrane protein